MMPASAERDDHLVPTIASHRVAASRKAFRAAVDAAELSSQNGTGRDGERRRSGIIRMALIMLARWFDSS
jgi:hypothetical protein